MANKGLSFLTCFQPLNAGVGDIGEGNNKTELLAPTPNRKFISVFHNNLSPKYDSVLLKILVYSARVENSGILSMDPSRRHPKDAEQILACFAKNKQRVV